PPRTHPPPARSGSRRPASPACRRPSASPGGGAPRSRASPAGGGPAVETPAGSIGPRPRGRGRPPGGERVARGDYWWIVFLFIGLQPVIKQRVLEASRLRVLKRLEQA